MALIARTRTALEGVADRLSAEGATVEIFPADVTDRPALRAALAAVEERLGPIDVLEYSPASTPAERTKSELVISDLPDDYLDKGLADKFLED